MTKTRFAHEPRTEQEVVCLFGALLDDLEMPLQIERVQTAFPDCTVRRLDTGEVLHVEFELYSSHFRAHGHPVDGCGMLVCWIDDVGVWPDTLQVIELADVVANRRPDLILSTDSRDSSQPWDQRGFLDRASADGATARDMALFQQIIDFARSEKLGPQWLANPSAVFAVGDEKQFFKVNSTGAIGFPFCRLQAGALFPELFRRLNTVLPELSLTEADARSKGKRGQLSQLFDSDERLARFLAVWKWFRGTKMKNGS